MKWVEDAAVDIVHYFMDIDGGCVDEVKDIIIKHYEAAYPKPTSVDIPKSYCQSCGSELNNLFSGISIVQRRVQKMEVCGTCCIKLEKEGWEEIARAR